MQRVERQELVRIVKDERIEISRILQMLTLNFDFKIIFEKEIKLIIVIMWYFECKIKL